MSIIDTILHMSTFEWILSMSLNPYDDTSGRTTIVRLRNLQLSSNYQVEWWKMVDANWDGGNVTKLHQQL